MHNSFLLSASVHSKELLLHLWLIGYIPINIQQSSCVYVFWLSFTYELIGFCVVTVFQAIVFIILINAQTAPSWPTIGLKFLFPMTITPEKPLCFWYA